MAYVNGPQAITSGLVLYLDAANQKSYSGSGTTWTDLTRNNNATLTNGPTFSSEGGGAIVFDGTNDYANLGNVLNVGTSDFALEMWYYKETQTNSFAKIVSKGAFQAGGWRILSDNTTTLVFQYGNPQSEIVSATTAINNSWNHGLVTRLNGNITIYVNGIAGTSTSVSTDLTTNSYNYQIATSPNSSENWKGRLAVYKHYSKGLSNQEALQNFNALRGRFGV
jgi:hypothetical protein